VPSDDALLLATARVRTQRYRIPDDGTKGIGENLPPVTHFAVYGGLEAYLEHISADSVVDDKGNGHFPVRVRTASLTD
jgi:adhesin transport system membrane fusion protein